MQKNGQKITETGTTITVNGEEMKIGILNENNGNARIHFKKDRKQVIRTIRGVFAIVQWFRRGEPLEKIAYNVRAKTKKDATIEMKRWIPKLQYPEYRETSSLIAIVNHTETHIEKVRTV